MIMGAVKTMVRTGKMAALTAVTCAAPPRYWRRIAEAGVSPERAKADPCREIYERALGISDEAALDAICAARQICFHEARMQVTGLAGPWRSWRPAIRLSGVEHLQAALAEGRGAILWASFFLYNHLVLKIALHQAGYRVTQLSRPIHGFGSTPFAVRFLNPIWTGVEDRFLRERVQIHGDEAGPAVRLLRSRLNSNGIVVITVGDEAVRPVEVAFLGHRLGLAPGAVKIAQSTRAALLPAFVVRNAEGVFEVTIERPLDLSSGGARGNVSGAVSALAQRLEPYVRRSPEQWCGWPKLVHDEDPAVVATGSGTSDPATALKEARPDAALTEIEAMGGGSLKIATDQRQVPG